MPTQRTSKLGSTVSASLGRAGRPVLGAIAPFIGRRPGAEAFFALSGSSGSGRAWAREDLYAERLGDR